MILLPYFVYKASFACQWSFQRKILSHQPALNWINLLTTHFEVSGEVMFSLRCIPYCPIFTYFVSGCFSLSNPFSLGPFWLWRKIFVCNCLWFINYKLPWLAKKKLVNSLYWRSRGFITMCIFITFIHLNYYLWFNQHASLLILTVHEMAIFVHIPPV